MTQEEIIADIKKCMVETKYKTPLSGHETAIWMVDISAVIAHIEHNYTLLPKSNSLTTTTK